MKIRLALFLFSLFSFTIVHAQQWDAPIEVPDTVGPMNGSTGQYTSMALVNGNPAIAFYNVTGTRLQFVRANNPQGSSWSAIQTPDNTGNVGLYASLAVIAGHPAIAYYDGFKRDLKYVRALDPAGNTWGNPVTIDSLNDCGQFASLCEVNGRPAISYFVQTSADLRYVRALDAVGVSWGSPQTIVSPNSAGAGTSLKVIDGNPAIAFKYSVGAGAASARYVRANDPDGAAWATMVQVETGGDLVDLEVVNGFPAIAHVDIGTNLIRFVRATNAQGSAWGSGIAVSPSAEDAFWPAMTVSAAGPLIAYFDDTNNRLKLSRSPNANGTGTWTQSVVDLADSPGFYGDVIMAEGLPSISYQSFDNANLNFIQATNATGSVWNSRISWDAEHALGEYASFGLVDGRPAFAYYDQTMQVPKFVSAANHSGTQWNNPIIPPGSGARGKFVKLRTFNGNPSMAYYDESIEYIKFMRSNDAQGLSWPLDVEVYPAQDFPDPLINMLNCGGVPGVFFFSLDASNRMYFRKATDANGSSFSGFPAAIDPTQNSGYFHSVALINGNPAVAHYEATNDNLHYLRSNNAAASTWGAPVVVDATGDVGQFTSLAEVNGRPAIAYYDNTNQRLKFVRANDNNGAAWGIPLTVSTLPGGRYAHLMMYQGTPVIFFQGGVSGASGLYMVKAGDSNGSTWGAPQLLQFGGQNGLYTTAVVNNDTLHVGWYNQQDNHHYYLRGLPCAAPEVPQLNVGATISLCNGESLSLTASANGEILWFDTVSQTPIQVGNTVVLGPLTASQNYEVRTRVCGILSEAQPLSVEVLAAVNTTLNLEACSGETIVFGGLEYTKPAVLEQILTSANGCDSVVNATLNFLPLPEALIVQDNEVLQALPNNQAASYQWMLCDGTLLEGETNASFPITGSGAFAVSIVLDGCADTSDCFEIELTASVPEQQAEEQVYPNPFTHQLMVKAKPASKWTLRNALGQTVLLGSSSPIETFGLPAGVYFLELDQRVYRLLKQ